MHLATRFRKAVLRGALSLAAAYLAGCPTVSISTDPVEPTLTSIQRKVFNPSCSSASCHGAPSFKAGLDLEEGTAYASLVGVTPENEVARSRGMKRVDPGNPAGSFLLVKLGNPGDGEGSRMPSRNAALSPQAVAAIAEWIRQGAKP